MSRKDATSTNPALEQHAGLGEYADDIFLFMMEKERETLTLYPNYLRWRKPLVQTIFYAGSHFKIDTCVLAVGIMDRFASRKGKSTVTIAAHLLGLFEVAEDEQTLVTATYEMDIAIHDSLQWKALLLLAGTALMISSKYEENQSNQVGMAIVTFVLGIPGPAALYKRQIAKTERVLLQVLEWDLGVPGPLPFLRHFIYHQRSDSGDRTRRNEPYEACGAIGRSQDLRCRRESKLEQTRLELVGEICVRVAMAQSEFIWHDPCLLATVCFDLALYLLHSSRSGGVKYFFTHRYSSMLAETRSLMDWLLREESGCLQRFLSLFYSSS
ncbi:hypothetical protein FOFC_20503 [Fusarium oxysporum]|nr:hypothetical protein FOFC_20503 [Fusarium oxysporum]